MKKIYFSLLLSLLFSTTIYANINLDISKIKNYKVLKEFYTFNRDKFIIIRSYNLDNKIFFLAINLDTLKSKIVNSREKLSFTKSNKDILFDTNYYHLSKKASKNSNILENAGINKPLSNKFTKNIYLTIDMCPSSKKGFEKEFFEKIKNLSNSYNKKVPISLAITHKWVEKHQDEFMWFLKNKNKLDITWVNHSKTHYYNPKEKKMSKNFMLYNLSKIEDEILDVEKLLILNQQIPSLLFRFPGLISDENLFKLLVEKYSLIPLGTNNWLAKEQKFIENNDIILVHGNLNEKKGIKIINKNIENHNLGSILDALRYK